MSQEHGQQAVIAAEELGKQYAAAMMDPARRGEGETHLRAMIAAAKQYPQAAEIVTRTLNTQCLEMYFECDFTPAYNEDGEPETALELQVIAACLSHAETHENSPWCGSYAFHKLLKSFGEERAQSSLAGDCPNSQVLWQLFECLGRSPVGGRALHWILQSQESDQLTAALIPQLCCPSRLESLAVPLDHALLRHRSQTLLRMIQRGVQGCTELDRAGAASGAGGQSVGFSQVRMQSSYTIGVGRVFVDAALPGKVHAWQVVQGCDETATMALQALSALFSVPTDGPLSAYVSRTLSQNKAAVGLHGGGAGAMPCLLQLESVCVMKDPQSRLSEAACGLLRHLTSPPGPCSAALIAAGAHKALAWHALQTDLAGGHRRQAVRALGLLLCDEDTYDAWGADDTTLACAALCAVTSDSAAGSQEHASAVLALSHLLESQPESPHLSLWDLPEMAFVIHGSMDILQRAQHDDDSLPSDAGPQSGASAALEAVAHLLRSSPPPPEHSPSVEASQPAASSAQHSVHLCAAALVSQLGSFVEGAPATSDAAGQGLEGLSEALAPLLPELQAMFPPCSDQEAESASASVASLMTSHREEAVQSASATLAAWREARLAWWASGAPPQLQLAPRTSASPDRTKALQDDDEEAAGKPPVGSAVKEMPH